MNWGLQKMQMRQRALCLPHPRPARGKKRSLHRQGQVGLATPCVPVSPGEDTPPRSHDKLTRTSSMHSQPGSHLCKAHRFPAEESWAQHVTPGTGREGVASGTEAQECTKVCGQRRVDPRAHVPGHRCPSLEKFRPGSTQQEVMSVWKRTQLCPGAHGTEPPFLREPSCW